MNHTILDHLDQCFDQLINPKPVKAYKFTIQYKDGKESRQIVKHYSLDQCLKNLKKWWPRYKKIVKCEKLL